MHDSPDPVGDYGTIAMVEKLTKIVIRVTTNTYCVGYKNECKDNDNSQNKNSDDDDDKKNDMKDISLITS